MILSNGAIFNDLERP